MEGKKLSVNKCAKHPKKGVDKTTYPTGQRMKPSENHPYKGVPKSSHKTHGNVSM